LIIKEGIDGQEICHFQGLKRKQTKKEKDVLISNFGRKRESHEKIQG